jgi:hypothetical protein
MLSLINSPYSQQHMLSFHFIFTRCCQVTAPNNVDSTASVMKGCCPCWLANLHSSLTGKFLLGFASTVILGYESAQFMTLLTVTVYCCFLLAAGFLVPTPAGLLTVFYSLMAPRFFRLAFHDLIFFKDQGYITTNSQSVSMSWCLAQSRTINQSLLFP